MVFPTAYHQSVLIEARICEDELIALDAVTVEKVPLPLYYEQHNCEHKL